MDGNIPNKDLIWHKFNDLVLDNFPRLVPDFLKKILQLPEFSFASHIDNHFANCFEKIGWFDKSCLLRALSSAVNYSFSIKKN